MIGNVYTKNDLINNKIDIVILKISIENFFISFLANLALKKREANKLN